VIEEFRVAKKLVFLRGVYIGYRWRVLGVIFDFYCEAKESLVLSFVKINRKSFTQTDKLRE
jgi:hypothetical protein